MDKEFFRFIKIYPQEYIDTYPTQLGMQWIKGQSCKNIIKDCYILHIVVDGRGYFKTSEKNYKLSQNQAFLIKPGKMVTYYADSKNPWSYFWIGFNGKGVEKMFQERNIDVNNEIFLLSDVEKIKEIIKPVFIDINRLGKECETKTLGLKEAGIAFLALDEFFNQVSKDKTDANCDIFVKTCDYINLKIRTVTVTSVCEEFFLNRTALFRIFKDKYQISPQQYIIKCRMTYAMELVRNTNIAFKNIAIYSGYSEYERFSRAFKNYFNESPKEVRRKRMLGEI